MGEIENKLIQTLQSESEKFLNDPKFKEFEMANSQFKELVKKGIVKERGYNLLTIDAAYLDGVHLNEPSN